MPKIDLLTAEAGTSGLDVPTAPSQTAEQFGEKGFAEMVGFSQQLMKIGANLKAQQDEVDTLRLTGQYDIALAEQKARVGDLEPDIRKQPGKMAEVSGKILDAIDKQPMNPAVRAALRGHAMKQLPAAIIDVQADSIKRQAQRTLEDTRTQIDQLVDIASSSVNDAEEHSLLMTAKTLADRMEARGIVTPAQHRELVLQGQNRYWELVALKNPDRLFDILETGQHPAHMDAEKMAHYMNLAVGSKNAMQFRRTQAEKMQEAAIKKDQERVETGITAAVLGGDTTALQFMPGLVAGRKVGQDFVTRIRSLVDSLAKDTDAAKVVPGLAAQYEGVLIRAKYEDGGLAADVQQAFISDFMAGRIVKEDFQRLMGKYAEYQTYKEQGDKTESNRSVTQAHTTLVRELDTVGPQDKYDPLSSLNVAAAEEYFYKQVDAGKDPWVVKADAVKLFQPVVKSRQNIPAGNKEDLLRATEDAQVRLGALSKVAVNALRKNRASEAARIIKEAQDALPPPEPPRPGWFEGWTKKPAPAGAAERRPKP